MSEIRARDQQDQPHRRPCQQQGRAHGSGDLPRQGNDVCADRGVRLRVSLRQPAGDRPHLALRLFRRHAGPQAGHDFQRMILPSALQLGFDEGERNPQVGPFRERLPLGHHADHPERLRVQPDLPADGRGVRPEFAAPEVLAQQRHRLPGPLFGSVEGAARGGLDAHRPEQTGARHGGVDDCRFALAQQGAVVHGGQRVGGHLLEAAGLVSPILKVRHRYLQLRQSRMGLPDLHQPAGVAKRERPEEDRVDDAEKGRVGADSQRHRQNGGGREHGPAPKGTDCGPHNSSLRWVRLRPVRPPVRKRTARGAIA